MRKTLISMLIVFVAIAAYADTFDDVAVAIKSANAKEVAKYFNSSVELTVLDNEGVYSKQQAEVILKNFFSQNPPRSVLINHRGSSAQGSKYAIATYECQKGRYRAYIFMKDSGAGMVIQELKFEKE
jgi:hypothetical protein